MIAPELSSSSIAEADVDAVVLALRKQDEAVGVLADPAAVPEEARTELERAFTAVAAGTGPWETTVIPAPAAFRAAVVIGVGLGPDRPDLAQHEVLRRAAGAAGRAARSRTKVGYALPVDGPMEAAAVLEGAILGAYSFDQYRSSAKPLATTTAVLLGAGDTAFAAADLLALTSSVHFCRDLVNEPPGRLRPSMFADRVGQAAAEAGLEVELLDAERLAADGSGGILGVGQGSSDPPLLLRIAYRHPAATAHLALIGKGITFDSGGLSLKPPKSMETMKCDMSGAAAVAAALLALSARKPAVNVTGWLAVAENMPGGRAQRPGDVVRMFGGKTVEVLNTDAEGRLVMADALARACQEQPDAVIDIATLTGAQMVALGTTTAGVMGNNDPLRDRISEVGRAAGESLWPMPLPAELRPGLDSPVADLRNIGDGPYGGMLTAGLFLKEFVPAEVSWGHIDIAGPAFNTGGPSGYTPKGGTGFGVRTLVAVAEALAAGDLLG